MTCQEKKGLRPGGGDIGPGGGGVGGGGGDLQKNLLKNKIAVHRGQEDERGGPKGYRSSRGSPTNAKFFLPWVRSLHRKSGVGWHLGQGLGKEGRKAMVLTWVGEVANKKGLIRIEI